VEWNKDIAGEVIGAWHEFMVSEYGYLVRENAREEAVCGAFYPFLRRLCEEWFVINVEYDKMNDELRQRAEKEIVIGESVHAVLPDIIIHRPRENDKQDNLLAIEMKKWANGAWRHDVNKLREMTSPPQSGRHFQYRFGLLIRFRQTGDIGAALLFEEGTECALNPKTLQRAE